MCLFYFYYRYCCINHLWKCFKNKKTIYHDVKLWMINNQMLNISGYLSNFTMGIKQCFFSDNFLFCCLVKGAIVDLMLRSPEKLQKQVFRLFELVLNNEQLHCTFHIKMIEILQLNHLLTKESFMQWHMTFTN